jgi:predicted enzyme related to lactoylglutathione lyase
MTVSDREPVGDMGFAAYFKDTEGNLVGLWETARSE